MFVRQGQQLPLLTRAMLAMSDFLLSYGIYLLMALGAGLVAFRFAMGKPAFRMRMHKRLLHLPLLAGMVRGVNTARYASTLSILTTSGVPLVDAMRIAGEVLGNDYLRQELKNAARKVSEGGALHRALDQSGYFPPMMLHMIASGELDSMLERTARMQENTLQAKIAAIVGLFEPLMLLLMGGVVLIIVMAIMLPILNMSNLVG